MQSTLVIFFYGLPAFVFALPLIPLAVYLPNYYAVDLKQGFMAVGLALFLSRLIDVLSDPLAGLLSDHSRSLPGGRKFWITLGALAAGSALIALADPPDNVGSLYLGLWSAVLYVGWTFVMVPYLALGADMAQGYSDSNRITASREIFTLLGTLFAVSLPWFIPSFSFSALPGLVLPVGLILLVAFILAVPEQTIPSCPNKPEKQSYRDVIKLPLTRQLLWIWFFTATASAIPAALFPAFVENVLKGNEQIQAQAIFIYFAAAVAGMPFWSIFAKGRSKHMVMATSMAIVCLVFPSAIFLGEGDIIFFYIICVLTGFALAGELVLAPSMMTDAAKLFQRRFGADASAMHFALWGVAGKLAFAAAILIAFSLLAAAQQVLPTSYFPTAVAVIYAGLPALLKLPSIFMLRRLPFSNKDRDLINIPDRKKCT